MKRLMTLSIVVLIIVAVTALPANSEIADSMECRVIRIHGMTAHGSIQIEPEILTVPIGTCVVWFNRSDANEIKVKFQEGKKCASVSDAPTGFNLDHAQCYVTSWIPIGGTSSLRFKEAGVFEYMIEEAKGEVGEKGKKIVSGKIIVH